MTRLSADDLLAAAEWLDAYEAEDGDGARDSRDGPYAGTDDVAEVLYRVSDWMRAEVEHRAVEARERRIIAQVQRETGKRPTRAQVRAALAQVRGVPTAR